MPADLAVNKDGHYMATINTNIAWWGETHYKVDGDFCPHDASKRMLCGVDPGKFYRTFNPKHPKTKEKYKGVKVVVRADTDSMISHVGSQTTIIQPDRFNQLAEQLLAETGSEVKAASYVFLNNCTKVAMTLALPSDEYKQKMVTIGFGTSNERAIYLSGWANKVVCSNTERMAWMANKITIRHTANWEDKIPQMLKFMQQFEKHWELAQEFEKELAGIKAKKEDVKDMIQSLLPPTMIRSGLVDEDGKAIMKEKEASTRLTNNRKNLRQFIVDGKGRDGDRTAKALFDGVTEYTSHPERRSFGSVSKSRYNARTAFSQQVACEDPQIDLETKAVKWLSDRYDVAIPTLN